MIKLPTAVNYLVQAANQPGRNLQMPGDGRYQPDALKPYLGYDQWAGWLIIVEWFWLQTLVKLEVIPKQDAVALTGRQLKKLLNSITTSQVDNEERQTKHDIIALGNLIRKHIDGRLRRWVHFCATSYDIIDTAYALQLQMVFGQVFMPQLIKVDGSWRNHISQNASVIQSGRTHLQTALPVTVGLLLANLHNRFIGCARQAERRSAEVCGKFTGAVGTMASQRALLETQVGENVLMKMLKLPVADISTQIVPPESRARFYFELALLSGALANLGEDVRILQSSQFGELVSASSTSSTMSHKKGNPIAAEQIAGMYVTVEAEFGKIMGTLVSDLQRDLRASSVMRSYSAILVYVFQQLKTTQRLLESLKVDIEKCRKNFDIDARLVVAELLHLYLQREGLTDAHTFINSVVVSTANVNNQNLAEVMDVVTENYNQFIEYNSNNNHTLSQIWQQVPSVIRSILEKPEAYLGYAVELAEKESENKL